MDGQRIALDVMGGDHAPDVVLEGALQACDNTRGGDLDPARVLLVGEPELIDARLAALGGDPGFGRLPATQVVGMDEKPAVALRSKPDSTDEGRPKRSRALGEAFEASNGSVGRRCSSRPSWPCLLSPQE